MTVTFYRVDGDARSLRRNKKASLTVSNVKPYDNCDMFQPRILLAYNPQILSRTHFFLSDTGRYYHMTGVEVTDGNRCIVSGEVDALLTYASEILSSEQMIVRTNIKEIGDKSYIPDNKHPISGKYTVKGVQVTVGNKLKHSDTYVVTTLGGSVGAWATKKEPVTEVV